MICEIRRDNQQPPHFVNGARLAIAPELNRSDQILADFRCTRMQLKQIIHLRVKAQNAGTEYSDQGGLTSSAWPRACFRSDSHSEIEMIQQVQNRSIAAAEKSHELGEALVKAASRADRIEEVTRLLSNRKVNVNFVDPVNGWTALRYAAAVGDVHIIEMLMSKGAKHDLRDKEGAPPLHVAASKGHKDAVACLLDHGADQNATDDKGFSPLTSSARHGHHSATDLLLLRGADPNLVNKKGRSALHDASPPSSIIKLRLMREGGLLSYTLLKMAILGSLSILWKRELTLITGSWVAMGSQPFT